MEKEKNTEPGKARIFTKAEIDAFIRNKKEAVIRKVAEMDENLERKFKPFYSQLKVLKRNEVPEDDPDEAEERRLPAYMTPILAI
jgi:hypothetical protein